jgi:hypothetical protein
MFDLYSENRLSNVFKVARASWIVARYSGSVPSTAINRDSSTFRLKSWLGIYIYRKPFLRRKKRPCTNLVGIAREDNADTEPNFRFRRSSASSPRPSISSLPIRAAVDLVNSTSVDNQFLTLDGTTHPSSFSTSLRPFRTIDLSRNHPTCVPTMCWHSAKMGSESSEERRGIVLAGSGCVRC